VDPRRSVEALIANLRVRREADISGRPRVDHTMADVTHNAVGLLTQRDGGSLGPSFSQIWPVEDSPSFSKLLLAIDKADREISQVRRYGTIDKVQV